MKGNNGKSGAFPDIFNIKDLLPVVSNLDEIKFLEQPNGQTLCCYLFADNDTFLSPESRECRGISFDSAGNVTSRPLHKFFNLGETADTQLSRVCGRKVVRVYEKLDGSMLATAWVNGKLAWRSKKSFCSDVVKLAEAYISEPEQRGLLAFAERVASNGMTAIFELTHPEARIVVAHEKPKLTLLHVRDNRSGEYLLLDAQHPVNRWVAEHNIPLVPRFDMSLDDALATLFSMRDREGYVLQFEDGDMVKLKCPWYLRLHRSITFLRERDIATLALHEELDDTKAALVEAGVALGPVLEVERRLKHELVLIANEVERMYADGHSLTRKEFALRNQGSPYFGLAMARYLGKEANIARWFEKTRLRTEFSLRALADSVRAESILA